MTQALLSFPEAPRALGELMDSLCTAAGSFRGGRGEWTRLRAAFSAHYAQAMEAHADQRFLAQLAETVAPVGSLWAASLDGPRYQLRRWDHQEKSPHPRPFAVLDATGEGEGRRRLHITKAAAELFKRGSRWRRVS